MLGMGLNTFIKALYTELMPKFTWKIVQIHIFNVGSAVLEERVDHDIALSSGKSRG
jgi:limonene-1,2-epoxide hydrolase